MPELPDLTVYLEALERRVLGTTLEHIRVATPFVLRTTEPPLASFDGRTVRALARIGKRLVFELDGERFLLIHLMIAGRLHWKPAGSPLPRRLGLAALDFPNGTLTLTEASRKHRAGIWTALGRDALRAHDPGGLEALEADLATFAAAIRRESHTVKRALTDPRIVSGIGNAYSDEILHAARLSPLKLTAQLSDLEIERLYNATRATLTRWTRLLRAETGDGFPEKVTAFREGMAVHGRYRQPCPVCGSPVQRIRYAANEANYCARCQTNGRVLADRSLSRLLREDWPRTLEEWEERMGRR
ncbi:MAG TPA: DNA-formamidopyrimidine glycosylase family protein [Gemmatimonadales bacterium]|nr:DNA-formamidopyrimidine glycosylase family protein [Gemmatimonadales bacterium]